MDQAAYYIPCIGRLDAHDHLAGLGAGNRMADRTDPADARGDRGHFRKITAFAEFLETAELIDMEMRVLHLPILSQGQW